ncbi:hypothetical protein HPB50_013312 [Hyalomma asiaticum]|uniref:Uncharacterized protein n=1 Tax=Hyalomma asiaticum TaxID=266040 RepID=A0ACB7RKI3_HYAAI|nr:hypothetical protein HPB50_013312 [Hyalomma asiaticum]
MQYGPQDAYGQQAAYATGIYSPGGTYAPAPAAGPYMDPGYAAASPAVYGAQPYATDAYGTPIMPSPSNPMMSPMAAAYDPGYVNYMYGMQPPRSPRRYIIQVPQRRKATFSTDNLLTVLIVCGTLFLVLLAMMIIVTVVVPRLTKRHHHSGHKNRHEFPNEMENLAEPELHVDAPQLNGMTAADKTESKHDSTGAKHGSKDGHNKPGTAKNSTSRTKG